MCVLGWGYFLASDRCAPVLEEVPGLGWGGMKQCQTVPCITLFPGEAGCFRPVAALHGDPIRESSMFRYASSHKNIHDIVQTHTYLCSLSASGALD